MTDYLTERALFIERIFADLSGGTDKSQHGYAPVYATLPPSIDSILELGIDKGFSLLAWTEIFQRADVFGIDTEPKITRADILTHPRIHVETADVRTYLASRAYDVIIDDCLHDLDTISVAWYRFRMSFRVAYIIEDVRPEIMAQVYELLTSTNPSAQILFWKTSNYRGDITFTHSDSHCFIVRP